MPCHAGTWVDGDAVKAQDALMSVVDMPTALNKVETRRLLLYMG
jgi:hypothetical protein